MNTRIHISLTVKDLHAALDFYQQLFAQAPSKLRDDYANFRLDEPPIHLALEQAAPGAPQATWTSGTHTHFGIELPDRATFGTWRDRLREAGARARDEHDAVCCYAKAEKLWLTDPDGNAWEVWVRTGEAEVMHLQPQACCLPARA